MTHIFIKICSWTWIEQDRDQKFLSIKIFPSHSYNSIELKKFVEVVKHKEWKKDMVD